MKRALILCATAVTLAAWSDAPTVTSPAAPTDNAPISASIDGLHHSSTPTHSVRWDLKAIVRKWVPFSEIPFDSIATDLIDKDRRSESEAAAILADSTAAAFDASIACFDSNYAYWSVRPSQADAGVVLGSGRPNHAPYPSAHLCGSGACQGVLTIAFPRERAYLEATAVEASTSRIIGGLHCRFDAEAGLSIGRRAALLAVFRLGIE